MIIMFIGPSSSGKDYFYKRILEKYNLNPIVMSTTRPIRNGETNGVEYNFISMDDMNKLDNMNMLIERRDYNTVHGIWSYATRGDNIDLSKDYLVINTWEGYQKYIEYFGDDIVKPIYFQVDDDIRLERAIEREKRQTNPKFDEMKRKFIADKEDFKPEYIDKYHPIVINNNGKVDTAYEQLYEVMNDLLKEKGHSK